MTARLIFTLAVAGFLGAIAHELAHWLIWRLVGREPSLDVWHLVVHPRAGPSWTTAGDRLAAAAPYALGLLVGGWGVAVGNWPAIFFGIFTVQIPSRSDVSTMLGRTEWLMSTQ